MRWVAWGSPWPLALSDNPVQHTVLYISLALFCMTTTWNFQKLLSYMFYGGNVVCVHCRSFSPYIVATSIFSFCHPRYKIFMLFFQQKNVSFSFFISRSKSLLPFFLLNFAGLPPTLTFSLCFSCCIFQICGHDNLSMLNTLNNMDTERIPPSTLLTLLFSLLYKTPVAMRFPTRITLSCIWVAIPVSRVWYPGWGTLRALEYLKRCKIIFWVLLECAHENCKHKVRHIKETVVNDMKVEMILAVE